LSVTRCGTRCFETIHDEPIRAVAVTIFGGFTPFVSTWLIAATGNSLSPSFYVMFTAALSILALVFVQPRDLRLYQAPGRLSGR
jgi:hypothetical protein